MANELRVIQSVQFRPDGVVEVQYAEARDQSENVAKVSICMFEAGVLDEQVSELQTDISDLLDAAIDILRTPPKKASLIDR